MSANSRFFRLALVLGLSSLSILSLAQTPTVKTASPSPATPTKDTVLFDFEGGDFDGWTLTGDCWDKAPATPKTFVDKQGQPLVSGIVGNGYLTTLYKNAATTGKAVSKDFTIDKPFLTFKIGGGRYPKEACLNLLVDGKIVRTETGFDSAELASATWDVSLLAGKTAHLEIIDNTANTNRGYIMVDSIALSMKSRNSNQMFPESEPILEIPLRIVQVLDSQGRVGFYRNNDGDTTTPMNLTDARQLLVATNELFRPAKIRFTLQAKDFSTVRDDYLNLDHDVPSQNLASSNRSITPVLTGFREHLNSFQQIADEHKDKLTAIIHRGSEWKWNDKTQQWDFGVGYSHGGSGLKAEQGYYVRIVGVRPRVFAHELGHSMGLNHTYKGDAYSAPRIVNDEQINQLCQQYIDSGGDPNHPEYAIDGDQMTGVDDTSPDPGIGFWDNIRDLTRTIKITLTNRKPFNLLVSRNNIMGARADIGGFSLGQILVMRRKTKEWKAGQIKR